MLLEDVTDNRPALAAALRDIHERARHLVVLVTDALSPGRGDARLDVAQLSPELGPAAAELETATGAARAAAAGIESSVLADLDKIATAAARLRHMVRPTPAADADRDPSAAPATAAAASEAADPATPTIPVVDDIAENREMLTRRLVRPSPACRRRSRSLRVLCSSASA